METKKFPANPLELPLEGRQQGQQRKVHRHLPSDYELHLQGSPQRLAATYSGDYLHSNWIRGNEELHSKIQEQNTEKQVASTQ